jgi:hypothetical protein
VLGKQMQKKLASVRHGNDRKSEEEIARALQFNGRRNIFLHFSNRTRYQKSINITQPIDFSL